MSGGHAAPRRAGPAGGCRSTAAVQTVDGGSRRAHPHGPGCASNRSPRARRMRRHLPRRGAVGALPPPPPPLVGRAARDGRRRSRRRRHGSTHTPPAPPRRCGPPTTDAPRKPLCAATGGMDGGPSPQAAQALRLSPSPTPRPTIARYGVPCDCFGSEWTPTLPSSKPRQRRRRPPQQRASVHTDRERRKAGTDGSGDGGGEANSSSAQFVTAAKARALSAVTARAGKRGELGADEWLRGSGSGETSAAGGAEGAPSPRGASAPQAGRHRCCRRRWRRRPPAPPHDALPQTPPRCECGCPRRHRCRRGLDGGRSDGGTRRRRRRLCLRRRRRRRRPGVRVDSTHR